MAYKYINVPKKDYTGDDLDTLALRFIHKSCEGLRFNYEKEALEEATGSLLGTSIKKNQIPYNMEKDIDRLCLENALSTFLASGSSLDAYNVYVCYMEMFIGDYSKTKNIIELLSEYEQNGSSLLLKHRDHFSHSVYVFAIGLAIYESNSRYRSVYKDYYGFCDELHANYHFLKYWGFTSLFHDIGYPFELPFEQVCAYFESDGEDRKTSPFVAYNNMDVITKIDRSLGIDFDNTNDLFADVLAKKFGSIYTFDKAFMKNVLVDKPESPENFSMYMDHAYFSATMLFHRLFNTKIINLNDAYMDSLISILIHNSIYKFKIANYKDKWNIPFKMEYCPLTFMLMLCDELQCWDRISYGRNTRKELHPFDDRFSFTDGTINVTYLFDILEKSKVAEFITNYSLWKEAKPLDEKSSDYILWRKNKPRLKSCSDMMNLDGYVNSFEADIKRIVDTTGMNIIVSMDFDTVTRIDKDQYLSSSNFIHLFYFAVILHGRWGNYKGELLSADEEKNLIENFNSISLEYKLSNINQAKNFGKYLDKIDCFYTDRNVNYEIVNEFTIEDISVIAPLEHDRWVCEHIDMGWRYGPRSEIDRTHPDMIENNNTDTISHYLTLSAEEQKKDIEPMITMLLLLKSFDGIRIYRLK